MGICSKLTSGLVSIPPRGLSRSPGSSQLQQQHVCVWVRGVAGRRPIMAEEAKKLAAYAAVDNHVQVGGSKRPPRGPPPPSEEPRGAPTC